MQTQAERTGKQNPPATNTKSLVTLTHLIQFYEAERLSIGQAKAQLRIDNKLIEMQQNQLKTKIEIGKLVLAKQAQFKEWGMRGEFLKWKQLVFPGSKSAAEEMAFVASQSEAVLYGLSHENCTLNFKAALRIAKCRDEDFAFEIIDRNLKGERFTENNVKTEWLIWGINDEKFKMALASHRDATEVAMQSKKHKQELLAAIAAGIVTDRKSAKMKLRELKAEAKEQIEGQTNQNIEEIPLSPTSWQILQGLDRERDLQDWNNLGEAINELVETAKGDTDRFKRERLARLYWEAKAQYPDRVVLVNDGYRHWVFGDDINRLKLLSVQDSEYQYALCNPSQINEAFVEVLENGTKKNKEVAA